MKKKKGRWKNEEPIDYAKIQQAATLSLKKTSIIYPFFLFPPEQRSVYKSLGGTPHLDGSYTVFGEVIEGIEIIDKNCRCKKPLTAINH